MAAAYDRPSFFEGQYLSAGDLMAIVEYLRSAQARHALGAHARGIAVGLNLTERSAPGFPERREVILQPGVAWDGFGRTILVARPTQLAESQMPPIARVPALDDPAAPGGLKGRLVRVWLQYDELAARPPALGFESCIDAGQNSRVNETFRVIFGDPAPAEQRDALSVGGRSVEATKALQQFDPNAPILYDASIPFQAFPSGGRPPRWLVPIGYVRWVALTDTTGYFANLTLVAGDHAVEAAEASRSYIGVIAEQILAAKRALVLRRRDDDPGASHHYAALISDAQIIADPARLGELQQDLVWVEGNLRVRGDEKINGGALHFRDVDGATRSTPLLVTRFGDDQLANGNRELRVVIGDTTQRDNRLVVGPTNPGAAPQPLAPRLVVASGSATVATEGRVGVNTATPNAALEVKGDWTNGEEGAVRISGQQPTIRFEGGNDVANTTWIVQVAGQPAGVFRVAHRLGAANWKGVLFATSGHRVGVGTDAPRNALGVRGESSGAQWDELLSLEDNGGTTRWHINLRIDGNGRHLNFAETNVADGRLFLQAGGNVGVGTLTPSGRLTINGIVQPAQGKLTFFSQTADVEYDGGNDGLFLFNQTPPGTTTFAGARVGIGSTAPYGAFAVRGVGPAEELVSFEKPDGTTRWHMNQALVGAPRGLNLAETNVADGRLFLREGGNVGIGTTSPQEKLHVNGSFVRVEGAGGEQAYIGGDGAGGPDVQIGSFNSSVQQVHFWNTATNGWMQIWAYWHGPSDARLKQNVEPLTGSLERIRALRGVSFEWRSQAERGAPPRRRNLGLIAQEVQKVAPEVVVRSGRGDLGIDYQGLVALLVTAVKELKAELDQLRKDVDRPARTPKRKAEP